MPPPGLQTEPSPGDPQASVAGGKNLLLPLASLDLSGRVIGRERIAELNPHRGEMALIDYVVWHSANFKEGVALKRVRTDEFWVDGHFPGRPMMPGVLMIEAAAQLGVFLYNARFPKPKICAFTHITDCSFRHSVSPGDDFYLLCKELKFSPRRFVSAVQGVVDGRVVFDGAITGMALG